MKHWHRWLEKLGWEQKIIFSAGALAVLPLLAILINNHSRPEVARPSTPAPGVDTLIPRGFVLVPIEVQNYEALDSILGRFGIVDLFLGSETEPSVRRLVARNVRLLRAPNNPSHFAILIREAEVSGILKQGGSFLVILKRPEATGTEFVNSSQPKRRRIVYEGG